MNEWAIAFITTIIGPAISAIIAFVITRRKERADIGKTSAEENGVRADTAGKYRVWLNEEIMTRRKVEDERDMLDDACKELREENHQLREENRTLRDRLRRLDDGAIGGGE